jgi:monothiol glutaredoxin
VLAGSVTLVDVRPADERSEAEVPVAHQHFDAGMAALEALPKDTALAFICKAGGRSAQAAEHFRTLGFRDLYNVTGGITAWADLDAAVPRY